MHQYIFTVSGIVVTLHRVEDKTASQKPVKRYGIPKGICSRHDLQKCGRNAIDKRTDTGK